MLIGLIFTKVKGRIALRQHSVGHFLCRNPVEVVPKNAYTNKDTMIQEIPTTHFHFYIPTSLKLRINLVWIRAQQPVLIVRILG